MNKGLNFRFKSYVFTIALYGKSKLSQVNGTKHARISPFSDTVNSPLRAPPPIRAPPPPRPFDP